MNHEIEICVRGVGWALLFLLPLFMGFIVGNEANKSTQSSNDAFTAIIMCFITQAVLCVCIIGSVRP